MTASRSFLISAIATLFLCLHPPTSRADVHAPYAMPIVLTVMKIIYPEALWSVSTRERIASITFDDGPGLSTPLLLDVLKKHNVKATFFILGNRAERYPATVRKIVREGHLIALHGYEHRSNHGLPSHQIHANIQKQCTLLTRILGKTNIPQPLFYRPPHGAISRRIIREVHATGSRLTMGTILPGSHSLFPKGWKETPDITVRRVLRDIEPGGIIILHDGEDIGLKDDVFSMSQSHLTADLLIQALHKHHYRLLRLDALLDYANARSRR